MAKRGISISVRLIAGSTLLLIVVIGLFSVVNIIQSHRIINDSSQRLQKRINESLRQAGKGQLLLLVEATRIALLQSDYITLQAIVVNIGKEDNRVTTVAVIDSAGNILAHNQAHQVGRPATGILRESLATKEVKVQTGIYVAEKKSIVFSAPLILNNTRLCTVFLAYSLAPLEAELDAAGKRMQKEIGATLVNTLSVGLVAVLLGILLTIIQGITFSRPIRALARQAERMASGELQARVDIDSRDEFGVLGERFNYMAQQLQVLIKETTAKATLEKELEVASTIQATLVPDTNVVDLVGIKLAGFFKPATQCGGDWWSYYRLVNHKTLVVIGDVTGHGVGSAMITAAAQGAASTMMAVTQGEIDLRYLLKAMNSAIHDTAKSKFVMTCFVTIYDPLNQTLQYANAGHNFPYIFNAETGKMTSLVARGNRLGDLVSSDYEVSEIHVKPDDTLFWYTDGIIECENGKGAEYGERRFREVILKNSGLPPDQSVVEIVGEAMAFYGGTLQKDDITLVVGKIMC